MESNYIELNNEEIIDVETPFENSKELENIALVHQSPVCDVEDSNSLPEEIVGKPPEIDYDSIGEFCFESDELALKGNSDYKNLLEAIVVLEAQKVKAVKDLELLKKLEKEALSDPFEFLDQFKRKEKIIFPMPQKIYPIPVIDWSKYVVDGNPTAFTHRQITLISEKMDELRCKTKPIDFPDQSTSLQKPWTTIEEEKLQILLKEIPGSICQADRWEKIANCLDERTALEVEEKVRLQTLGAEIVKNKISEASRRKEPDIESTDFDFIDDNISLELKDTSEYQELVLLKRVMRKKLDSTSLSCHKGFKCCRCLMEPIVGVRWHCIDCRPPFSTDFCNDCKDCSYENRIHKLDHQVERIHVSKAFLDRDYVQFLGDYNYLDPNYMPAT